MRVLVVQQAPWDPVRCPGALEGLLSGLCNGLADKGHDVVLASLGDKDEQWQNPGERLVRQTFSPATVRSQIAEMSTQFDVVSVHNRVDLLTEMPDDVPLSLFLHGPAGLGGWPGRFPTRPGPFDIDWDATVAGVRRATRTAGPSRWSMEYNLELFGTQGGDVVTPFVDAAYPEAPRAADQLAVAVYLGRPIRRKGLPWLHDHRDRWQFPWAWAGDPRHGEMDVLGILDELGTPLGSPKGVREMTALLSQVPVVMCPYDHEGFGMVLPEAAAAGCRVVGFDHCGLTEFRDHAAVELVEPWDVEAFNAAVMAALQAGPVGQDERTAVAATYSREQSAAAYEAHLVRTADDAA